MINAAYVTLIPLIHSKFEFNTPPDFTFSETLRDKY